MTKQQKDKDKQETTIPGRASDASTGRPVITVDYEKYAHFLDDSDLTEDQKQEFLQMLWNIIVEFVSMGFGVHPLQQAQEICGQLGEDEAKPRSGALRGVDLKGGILRDNFEGAADLETDAEAEGVE